MRTLLVALTVVNWALAQQCPPGFTASIYSEYNYTLCTKVLPGTANREEAYNLCRANGGALPMPTWDMQNAAIAAVAGGDYWLGQNCITVTGTNQSSCSLSGTTGNGNTDNGQGNLAAGTCLYGDSTGLWHNSDCFVQQAKVVCVPPSDNQPPVNRLDWGNCFKGYVQQALFYDEPAYNPPYILQFTPYCYKYYGSPADYSTAEATCQRDGGNLASIRIGEENQFIKDLIYYKVGPFGGSSYTRIGLSKDNEEHKYTWESWVAYVYTNFLNPNYANGGSSYDCVVMDSNGKWIPAPCTGTASIGGFVCKRMASSRYNAL